MPELDYVDEAADGPTSSSVHSADEHLISKKRSKRGRICSCCY